MKPMVPNIRIGGEGFHRVEIIFLEGIIRYGVRQRKSGHICCHTEGVDGEDFPKTKLRLAADDTHTNHADCSDEVANSEHALGLDEAVCQDAHNRWHKDGHDTLDGVEPADVGSHAFAG